MHIVGHRSRLEQQVLEPGISGLGIGVPQLRLEQRLILLKESLSGQHHVRVVVTNRNAVVSGSHISKSQRTSGVLLVRLPELVTGGRTVDATDSTTGLNNVAKAVPVLGGVAGAVSEEHLVEALTHRLLGLHDLGLQKIDDGGFAVVLGLLNTGDGDASGVLLPLVLGG